MALGRQVAHAWAKEKKWGKMLISSMFGLEQIIISLKS